jgi:Spx/MgsR family transcriptional regulator
MITIYGIKNCNSMKKAFTLLDELGVAYQFHDYKKAAIDAAILQTWATQVGLESLINRKGTTWRGLSHDEQAQAQSLSGAIALMQQKSSVIKRPVITDGLGGVICGLDEERIRRLA